MRVELIRIVPFGRTRDEYVRLFRLSEADRAGRIIGVGDGPASFYAEATVQ